MIPRIQIFLGVCGLAAALLVSGQAIVCAQTIDDCIECHMDRTLTTTDAAGKSRSLYVDKQAFIASAHGQNSYTCVDCHTTATADSHPAEGLPEVQCGECHEEALKAYNESRHGKLLASGNPDAPRCYDCHTTHAVLASDSPQASTHAENLQETCGACHEQQACPPLPSLIATRVKGHGKVNPGCEFTTRRCGDCHFETIRHGDSELQAKECASCHDVERSSAVFGTIHKAGVLKSPVLIGMLIVLYLAGLAGLVLFFKPRGMAAAQPGDKPQEPAS
jgi:hypothetical protein